MSVSVQSPPPAKRRDALRALWRLATTGAIAAAFGARTGETKLSELPASTPTMRPQEPTDTLQPIGRGLGPLLVAMAIDPHEQRRQDQLREDARRAAHTQSETLTQRQSEQQRAQEAANRDNHQVWQASERWNQNKHEERRQTGKLETAVHAAKTLVELWRRLRKP